MSRTPLARATGEVVNYNQMVVHDLGADEADRIFHALADATRRDIVVRVVQHEQSVSTLAEGYAMSFAAVQKHVAVLERAALVVKERRGREQIVHGNLDTVRRATRLLRDYEDLWRFRVHGITGILSEDRAGDDRASEDRTTTRSTADPVTSKRDEGET